MSSREEYIAELKVRLDRFNAAIARASNAAGPPLAALREQRSRVLAKLRAVADDASGYRGRSGSTRGLT